MIWRGEPRLRVPLLLVFTVVLLGLQLSQGFINLDKKSMDTMRKFNNKSPERRRIMNEAELTTPELIRGQGYPAEVHQVVTKDGYILELHRIPHGVSTGGDAAGKRPVAYLQHCLLCSSSDWVMNTPDKALAYILADKGYDVWLGNIRGNTYTRKHKRLSPEDPLFWKFSWGEMGKYDLPASIDYVLNATQQEKLYYVGFSMGTTVFFTMVNYHPEYNDKVYGMVALAPVAYVRHIKGPLGVMMPYTTYFTALMQMAGVHELLPSGAALDLLVSSFCTARDVTAPICHNILFALAGPDTDMLNQDYLPVILSHTPAGTSLQTLVHYMQNGRANRFQEYDYGFFGNYQMYGQARPRSYNLTKVTAPVAVFYSENDWLAPPKDVKRLLVELPNIVAVQKVQNANFSHVDFVWARDARALVYKPLLKVLTLFPTEL